MRKEQPQRKDEPGVNLSSLRDYWNDPAGHTLSHLPQQPRRRTISPPVTPSLWKQSTLLDISSGRAASPIEKSAPPSQEPLYEQKISGSEENQLSGSNPNILRERLQRRGVSSLSDAELFSVVLEPEPGSESIGTRIRDLLDHQSLPQLLRADFGELCEQYGFGEIKATQLQAMLEIGRRLLEPDPAKYTIGSAADAALFVRAEMEFLDHEELRVLLLDTKRQVTADLLLYQGTVNSSVIRAAEIFRPAVTRKCPGIIVCHNHPTGQPDESVEDIAVTKLLLEAGKVLEIELVDHLIIGKNGRFTSLKAKLSW